MSLPEREAEYTPTLPIEDRVLGKADIDACHDAIRQSVEDPRDGMFGPDSMMWRMVEPLPVVPFMLLQAGLLEGAAPKIWFGTEYSVTRSGDYVSRFARSYDAFLEWFVGDLETALRRGRKIYGYHSRVGGVAPHGAGHMQAGQEYRANEQQLMLFTVGTQIVPIKQCYEILHGPLSEDECECYWQDCRRFCLVFGIDPNEVPEHWSDFERYWDRCLHSGEMEAPTEGYSRYGPLVSPDELPWFSRVMTRWVMSVQFNLMPEHLRRQFARRIPLAAPRPRLTAATCFAARWTLRILPRDLTTAPRVRGAQRRVDRGRGPGVVGRWVSSRLPHPFGSNQPSLTIPASSVADPDTSAALRLPPI